MSYKTAWYLCHRIRAAMLETQPKKFSGIVGIDETYVGEKKRRRRPRSVKQVVFGIRRRNGNLRFIHAEDNTSETVKEIIKANIGSHVEVIMTDESRIYPYVIDKMHAGKHQFVNHSREYLVHIYKLKLPHLARQKPLLAMQVHQKIKSNDLIAARIGFGLLVPFQHVSL